MGFWQIILFLAALSSIEIVLSETGSYCGFGFACLSVFFARIHPALILLPVYLIALQYLYFGLKDFMLLRLTAEARMRRGYINLRKQLAEEALASRLRIQ